jgi:transcriptional regulator with XRE-family HTH domain
VKTTNEYLDEVKAKLALPSEYALAKVLGITQPSVMQYRNGRSALGIETSMKIGELLGIDGHVVYANGQIERAKNPQISEFWKTISEKFSESFKSLLSGASPRRMRLPAC